MTFQSFRVLQRIKKLSNNSDRALRFYSDGMIYPFTSDTPCADCSKYKKEIISIMDSLKSKGYIQLSSDTIRLTQEGIHFWQNLISLFWKFIHQKLVPFIALIVSIISLMVSFNSSTG